MLQGGRIYDSKTGTTCHQASPAHHIEATETPCSVMNVALCVLLSVCLCTVLWGSAAKRSQAEGQAAQVLKSRVSNDQKRGTPEAQAAVTMGYHQLLDFTSILNAVPAEDCGSEGQVRELHAVVVPCLPAQPLWRGGRQGRLPCSIQALSYKAQTICTYGRS